MMEILYEDKYITVCVKPVGVLSEEDGNKRSMPLLLKEHYAQIGQRQDVYTLHRLDKNVGGVMVFARNPRSASILATAIGNRQVTKEYHAVVTGRPEAESGKYTDLLLHGLREFNLNIRFSVDQEELLRKLLEALQPP